MTNESETIDPTRSAASTPDRRTLLRAAGAVTVIGGSAALLAACGGSATGETPASEAAAPSSRAAGPSESASTSASKGSTAQAPSGPSVAESSVPEGSGVIMDDADYVVTQPSAGQFKAFSKICTHQGCPVTQITSTIDCQCHGSQFSITDGSVVNGPATQPLPESKTTVTGGKVYVDV